MATIVELLHLGRHDEVWRQYCGLLERRHWNYAGSLQ